MRSLFLLLSFFLLLPERIVQFVTANDDIDVSIDTRNGISDVPTLQQRVTNRPIRRNTKSPTKKRKPTRKPTRKSTTPRPKLCPLTFSIEEDKRIACTFIGYSEVTTCFDATSVGNNYISINFPRFYFKNKTFRISNK
jgi:hypothetical protein